MGLEVLGGKTLLEWERSGFGSIRGKDAVEWAWWAWLPAQQCVTIVTSVRYYSYISALL